MRTDTIESILTYYKALASFYGQGGAIKIPNEFHELAAEIELCTKQDSSGMVNMLADFMINSASNVDYYIETPNKSVTLKLNTWLETLNKDLNHTKVEAGIQALARQYFTERWTKSSLLLNRSIFGYDKSIELVVPTMSYFVKGGRVIIEEDTENPKIGAEKYILEINDKEKITLPSQKSELNYIQCPYSRWTDRYPNPFYNERGILHSLKLFNLLTSKSEKIIASAQELLEFIKKGNDRLAVDSKISYTPEVLKDAQQQFNEYKEKTKDNTQSTPAFVNYDTQFEQLMPDYSKAINEGIYAPIERRILQGFGMVDVLDGTSNSIDKEEFVVVKLDGIIKQIRVVELDLILQQNKNIKVEVPTYENGLCVWKLASLWSHPYQDKMFELISDDGQMRVRTTKHHSIMVWDSKTNNVVSKLASDIKIGDKMVILKQFPTNPVPADLTYYECIGTNQYTKVRNEKKIEVTEDLAYFLGWYVAEGCNTKYTISLCIGGKREQAEEVLKVGEKVFQRKGWIHTAFKKGYKNPVYNVLFSSQSLASLFRDICGQHAGNKKIPEVILNSNENIQEAFIYGLLSGDGHYNPMRKTWLLTTKSEKLAYNLILLGRQLGKYPHLQKQRRYMKLKNSQKQTYYNVYFAQKEGILKELLPTFSIANKGYITNLNHITNTINQLPKDWSIKRVGKINTYDYNDQVYDLEVEDNPMFVAGTNVLVHNSRKESILNPKPMAEEIKAGIKDFKAMIKKMLRDIVLLNQDKNSLNIDKIEVRSSSLSPFISKDEKEQVRRLYQYGLVSKQTAVEFCGGAYLEYSTEVRRRTDELERGEEVLMYAQVIQNNEKDVSDTEVTRGSKPTPDKEVPESKKGVDAQDYTASSIEEICQDLELSVTELAKVLETSPYSKPADLPSQVKNKMAVGLQRIFIRVFNQALKRHGNETTAFKIAWSVISKNAHKNKEGKWVRNKPQTKREMSGQENN